MTESKTGRTVEAEFGAFVLYNRRSGGSHRCGLPRSRAQNWELSPDELESASAISDPTQASPSRIFMPLLDKTCFPCHPQHSLDTRRGAFSKGV